jgi:hypothetical protein
MQTQLSKKARGEQGMQRQEAKQACIFATRTASGELLFFCYARLALFYRLRLAKQALQKNKSMAIKQSKAYLGVYLVFRLRLNIRLNTK